MIRLQSAFVITASLIGIAVASTLPASAQQNPPPTDTRILRPKPSIWCFAPMCDSSRFTDKLENSPNLGQARATTARPPSQRTTRNRG